MKKTGTKKTGRSRPPKPRTADAPQATQPGRRRYSNPPIIEAVCDLRFSPSRDWDWTIPGKLHLRLKEEYPGHPNQKVRLSPPTVQVESEGQPTVISPIQFTKIEFPNEDRTRLVGVGQDMLSVHMLPPYQDPKDLLGSGWDEFFPKIQRALKAYWTVAKPKGTSRIGLRYINRIIVPEGKILIQDFFNVGPPAAAGLPESISQFVSRCQYVFPDNAKLVLTHAHAEATEKELAFILDLDVFFDSLEGISQKETIKRIATLRNKEREVFEALITDRTRGLFNAG